MPEPAQTDCAPESIPTYQPPLDKLYTERLYFILAMQELADDRVQDNPYSALVQEVLPEWQNAGHALAPTSTASPKFRYRPENGARRATIEKWARKYRLIGDDGEPAYWIVGWAENLFQKLSGELRGSTTIGQIAHGDRLPRPHLALTLPMIDPFQRDGEPLKHFQKRVRRAVNAYFDRLAASRENVTPPRDLAPAANTTVGNKVIHSKWLILSRCCGWTSAKIRAKYGANVAEKDDSSAIRHAVNRKARVLGVGLRSEKRVVTK